VRTACEAAKVELSCEDKTVVEFEDEKGKQIEFPITRTEYEEIVMDLMDRCVTIMEGVLADCSIASQDIDEVIMVGGSTRTPWLRQKLTTLFNRELCTSVHPDRAVAEGAAIQGAILAGTDKTVLQDVMMMDVLPISLGLETADGSFEVLLPRNSSIPAEVTKHFHTFEQDQRGITVEIFEGEDPVARNNQHVGYFNFVVPKHLQGRSSKDSEEAEHLPVTFALSAAGTLQVRAGTKHESVPEEYNDGLASFVPLISYCVLLFALYVFCRIYFSDLFVEGSEYATQAQHVDL
jgi:L1 cell adhesion molecule like protein